MRSLKESLKRNQILMINFNFDSLVLLMGETQKIDNTTVMVLFWDSSAGLTKSLIYLN